MTPVEILAEAAAAGLRVDVSADGSLLVRPRDKATEDLVAKLRAHKPVLIQYLSHRESLMRQTADELRQHPERSRAAKIEPDDAGGYLAAIAVRMIDDKVVTATLTVPPADPFELIALFNRACEMALQ